MLSYDTWWHSWKVNIKIYGSGTAVRRVMRFTATSRVESSRDRQYRRVCNNDIRSRAVQCKGDLCTLARETLLTFLACKQTTVDTPSALSSYLTLHTVLHAFSSAKQHLEIPGIKQSVCQTFSSSQLYYQQQILL